MSTPGLSRKNSDALRPGRSGSYTRPHSASPDCAFVLTPTEETPSKVSPGWNMSRWDLLPPLEELPYTIVKDSKYAGAPIFGLEKPIYQLPGPHVGLAKSGEPMDLGDDCGIGMNDPNMQRIDVDASVATSGVVSGADGIVWDLGWLDEVDLSNTEFALDDVDLSGFDFPALDGDILTDLGPHFLA